MERQLQLMYEEQRKLQALVDTTKSHAEETEERAYRAEQFAQQMLDQQRYASPATPVEATHIPAPMDSTDSDLDGDKRLASSEDEVHDEMITVGNEKECQEAQWLRARVEDDDGPSSDDQVCHLRIGDGDVDADEGNREPQPHGTMYLHE